MTGALEDWERRIAEAWDAAADRDEDEVVAMIAGLAAQRPAGDAAALYEHASALDYAGREAEAEPLYRAAIAGGLDERRRPLAVIQLASTIRNLGRAAESVDLLREEISRAGPQDDLHDARVAFLALALVDAGRPVRAVAEAVTALAAHRPRFRRAITSYADDLRQRPVSDETHPRRAGEG
jgi:hypothetical protein